MRLHHRSWSGGDEMVSEGALRLSRTIRDTHYWFLSMCKTFLPSTDKRAERTHSVTPVLHWGVATRSGLSVPHLMRTGL